MASLSEGAATAKYPLQRDSERPPVSFATSMKLRFLASGLLFFAVTLVLAALPVLAQG
jgi:hypothetical protein